MLYRTNAQSRVLEEVFINYRIPYKIVGGLKFYERREIKDLICYLRLVFNPYDSVSLRRVINVPTRGVGTGSLQKIDALAAEKGVSLWAAVSLAGAGEVEGIRGTTRKGVESFVSLIAYLHGKLEEYPVTRVLQELLDNTGYLKELEREKTVEAQTRAENVKELLTVTQQFEQTTEVPTLGAFLEQTALIADIDSLESSAEAVVMMTLHSAKGLEFPVVFLAGMEEGVFPHSRSMQSDREMEEERRLAYVGITRAREELFLTFADRRTIFGSTQVNQVSRFIREIPDELFHQNAKGPSKAAGATGSRVVGRWSRDEYSQVADSPWGDAQSGAQAARKSVGPMAAEANAKPASETFKIGQKVKHAVFGTGTVLSAEGTGDDANVTVAFPNLGVKKLVAGYARLEKV